VCLAIPGQVVEFLDGERQLAKVEVGGVRRNVNVTLLGAGPDAVNVGDWVLIHVGFAMSRIDERQARETLAFLERLGELYEEELDELRGSAIH
jgi:hydrogenase expression/formation protein HypC